MINESPHEAPVHIGDKIDFDREIDNSFTLTFLPLDFFDHWNRASLMANFVADYYLHNFPDNGDHNLISTVLNELIENAVKFSRNNSTDVEMTIRKRGSALLMRIVNCIPDRRVAPFLEICNDLFTHDLDELYVQKLTENAEDTYASGIGLILIKKDYSSALSFDFIEDESCEARVSVTTELNFPETTS